MRLRIILVIIFFIILSGAVIYLIFLAANQTGSEPIKYAKEITSDAGSPGAKEITPEISPQEAERIIKETALRVINRYIRYSYYPDFFTVAKMGYNEVLSDTGYPENQFKNYPDAIIVEYYYEPIKVSPWCSLRIVFEQYQNNWYVVGMLSGQWTT